MGRNVSHIPLEECCLSLSEPLTAVAAGDPKVDEQDCSLLMCCGVIDEWDPGLFEHIYGVIQAMLGSWVKQELGPVDAQKKKESCQWESC